MGIDMPRGNQDDNPAYPHAMENIERELLTIRRTGKVSDVNNPAKDISSAVGIGLSGGGIRSATFCLGLFQGLAKQTLPSPEAKPNTNDDPGALASHQGTTLLSKVDYLSTVSGGGYFGGFYGGLFARNAIAKFGEVEEIFKVSAATEEEIPPGAGKLAPARVFRWLRENGRYLAPKGSGDLILGGAVFVRNAIAVQIVWATFVLMLFLLALYLRGWFEGSISDGSSLQTFWAGYQHWLVCKMPLGRNLIWWSPYTILPAVTFLLLAAPPGWAYWLIEKPNRVSRQYWIPPIVGLLAVLVVAVIGARQLPPPGSTICTILAAVAVWTVVWAFFFAGWRPWGVGDSNDVNSINRNEETRNRLSRQLKTALVLTGALLAFVIIDSLAQTAYGAWICDQFHLKRWMVAAFGPLVGLVTFARTILTSFGGGKQKRVSLPIMTLAGIAAFIVALLLLTAFDFAAYTVTWNMDAPSGPRPTWKIRNEHLKEAREIRAMPAADGRGWLIASEPENSTPPKSVKTSSAHLKNARIALALTFIFSFLFGWSWPFLNRSTQHPIYTSRLIRAYLGASNSERLKHTTRDVTETINGDDIPQETYWPRYSFLGNYSKEIGAPLKQSDATILPDQCFAQDLLFQKGMPIHLVNVTVNETIDGPTQIEQQDRKGMGMAIGPAGLSVAVKHHLVLTGRDRIDVRPLATKDMKDPERAPYRVFNFDNSTRQPELLTLGNWVGISGAAFSTSLGWRTSISLSLLAGLANVRLSYWWNSGTNIISGKNIGGLLSTVFQTLFSVQSFLFDEFLARFHGTARRYWPLSDGGHFENMGGYELIRRRLKMIIIVDAEADPDYSFEGLSNLVRKARLDFGTEIRFLEEGELTSRVNSGVRKFFGTLEQLRRGKWVQEPVADPNRPGKKRLMVDSSEEALSLAHASLAEITYPKAPDGQEPRGLLLYLKPTLIGDEPADVRRYHTEHPSFPHETTAEQFFDEAQWESYRRLGQHIADKVFRNIDDGDQPLHTETNSKGKTLFVPYSVIATA